MMYPVGTETGIGHRLSPIQTVKEIIRYVVLKVTREGNLDVSVYSVGNLMVFPSVEEFSKTRFGVQSDLHLPGTVGH
jgi:hypothetical protein